MKRWVCDVCGRDEDASSYAVGDREECGHCIAGVMTVKDVFVVEVIEAPETPRAAAPECLQTCGTAHRGHDPQCPVEWYERGQAEAEGKLRVRLTRILDDL